MVDAHGTGQLRRRLPQVGHPPVPFAAGAPDGRVALLAPFPRTCPFSSCAFHVLENQSLQHPVLVKEFASVTSVHFSPVKPHDFAVTSSTRVQIYSTQTNSVRCAPPLSQTKQLHVLYRSKRSSHASATSPTRGRSVRTESSSRPVDRLVLCRCLTWPAALSCERSRATRALCTLPSSRPTRRRSCRARMTRPCACGASRTTGSSTASVGTRTMSAPGSSASTTQTSSPLVKQSTWV